MSNTKHERLYGWGHSPEAECTSFRPEKRRDLHAIVTKATAPLIARGLGRSYADAALQPTGVVRTERLDHIIEFDSVSGLIRAQAGVSLSDIMALSIPKGWLPPVIPGTRHVTIGGALASNVHGKNHFRAGDFAEHVTGFRLLTASGEAIECTPESHGDIFWATAGGMGMTGIIEEVTLKLRPIASASLGTLTYRVDSVDDMIAAFEHYRNDADYMVGWIDHMAKGDSLGRGVFETASHIGGGEGCRPLSSFTLQKPRVSVPFFMPPMLLNRYVMALYNRYRFKKYSHERVTETVDFNGFFHPLDNIGHWNRLYGRRGFFQYQCVLPETPDVARHLHNLLSSIQSRGIFSFLAVLKYHREGKGLLTFPVRGYSLALDFPNTRSVRSALPQLDRWVAEHGGRTYLAKDAQLTPETFFAMYGQQARDWCEIVRDIDPQNRFSSLMSERLQWKQAR